VKNNLSVAANPVPRIEGVASNDLTGRQVADAGDVNADGRDDVLVGAMLARNSAGKRSGAAYVVSSGPAE
jgi:hypothetical protein